MGIMLSAVSRTKKVKYCMIIYMWNIKLREIESRMVVTKGCGVGEMRIYWSKGQTSNYKISKFWGSNVQYGDCS